MTTDDWKRVIDQGRELGVTMVQFIGGEPTRHPHFAELVDHTVGRGVQVEVFSNLVAVPEAMWQVLSRPRVRLATSYYSDQANEHELITQVRGSHARTTANIIEAVRRSIPLRVGVINVQDGQRADHAERYLRSLGVRRIDTDRLRQVGRGVRDLRPDLSQLCGQCARGKVAISPDGEVWPCVFARWMSLGNVRATSLEEILTGEAMRAASSQMAAIRGNGNPSTEKPKCSPETRRDPSTSDCKPSCPPGYHSKGCWPDYYDNDEVGQ
jgi:radical SAM protein with 4Fe4S-binding SPASM domain